MRDDELAQAIQTSRAMNVARIENYVQRGRSFEKQSAQWIEDTWISKVRAIAQQFDHDSFDVMTDLQSEMSLRGLPLPDDQVSAERQAITESTQAALSELRKDPVALKAANEEFAAAREAALTPRGRLS